MCNDTHLDSQVTYTRDLESVKGELLKIQEQSATELAKYERTIRQMAADQTDDLKKQRQFVKDLVSEISAVETLVAAA